MSTPALSELLRVPITCLDHGFVQLMDVMGDDHAIVEAARVSIEANEVKATSSDEGLIRYLLSHAHTSPFEMVEFKFRCKMPIFVARQWIRHRTASINEMSARYGVLPDEFYVPEIEHVEFQSTDNKQGRSGVVPGDLARTVVGEFRAMSLDDFAFYHGLLGQGGDEISKALAEGGGLARELARINLPLSTYTQWVWKIDLHNLMHFLKLRLDKHAQYEIRVFAKALATTVRQVCPLAWDAFEDFRLNAVTFSATELAHLKEMLVNITVTQEDITGARSGTLRWKTKREGAEFIAKLKSLGIL